jgi:SAM-dependent methyltransferase
LVEGRSVLEFGPGSGHNSIYTASLNPSTYDLVDANPTGLKSTSSMLSKYEDIELKVHESLFLDFKSEKKFDIVWAENCIPGQANPIEVLDYVKNFVQEKGILVITVTNGISILSEVFRRMVYYKFFKNNDQIIKQADALVPFFQNHTRHLKGMSRSTKDWILDNILQPMFDRKMLALPEVVQLLGKEFEIYSTSPKFLVDWRWYKEVVGKTRMFNEKALECYYQTNINLLDYRYEHKETSVEFGIQLEKKCQTAWELSCLYEKNRDNKSLEELLCLSEEIQHTIEPISKFSAEAISQAISLLRETEPRKERMEDFEKWWGRGTQYVSLIRN